MANDTAINSVPSSDSSTTAFRKKTKAESIEVNRLSFFDALLSIGQFESIVPQAIGPTPNNRVASDTRPEDSSSSQPDDAADTSKENSSLGSQAAQTQVVVPLTPQLQSSDLEKTTEGRTSEDNQVIDPKTRIQAGGKSDSTQRKPSDAGNEVAKIRVGKSTQEPVAANIEIEKDVSSLAAENLNSNGLNQELVESDGKTQPPASNELSDLEPIQKSDASLNSSNADTDQSQAGKDKSQAISEPDRTTASIESHHVSDGNDNGSSATPRRNKRAEYLAQRASESDPVSTNPGRSDSFSQAIESTTPKDKTDAATDPSSVSGTSLPSSLSPVPSISPVIATPIALGDSLLRGNVTSASSRLSLNTTDVSAVGSATTRGGIQTDTSNSSYTGAVSNPGRSEQSRGEIARSNSGTQISAYQEVKLVQRVLRGVEQLANGGGQVRLRLHPPELGSLQMSLRMEAGQVFAKLEVENSTARDALLNNVQSLKDRMAEQGMNVATFEVEVSTDSAGSGTSGSNMQRDGGSDSQSRWDNATSRFAQQNSNRISAEPGPADKMPVAAWTRNNGSFDLTV